jgi:hypothetical protein
MKHAFLTVLFVLVFLHPVSAISPSERQQSYAGRCINAIISCDYPSAFSIVDSVIGIDTVDQLAPLLRLAAIGIRDVDFDTLLDTADFFRTFRMAEERIAAVEMASGTSSYSKMLLGFCKGFHAVYYLRQKSYYTAMRNGFKALDLLDESHRLDTANVDPFFLLGLYDYAKGELKRRMWGILFWYPGSKKNGIARLMTCANSGYLTAGAALMALADVYIRENRLEDCTPVMERLEKLFPHSRFMLWEKAKYCESRRLFYEASLVYDLLAVSYGADSAGHYNSLVTRNLQAHMLFKSSQLKDARECCTAILREHVNQRNKVIFKDTEKLLEQINDDEH